jgi:uncharacterized membrane protein
MNKTPLDETQVMRFGDPQMESMMGRLLQAEVLLASAVVLMGGVLYLHGHHGGVPNYRSFSSEPAKLRQLGDLRHGLSTGDPATIIQLGVLLLIATPVARVAFALVAFAIERDKLYVAVSLIVLVVLLLSFFRSQ